MSLFFNRTASLSSMLTSAGLPTRSGTSGVSVTSDTALRHSAVWACLRLRADLISTTPLDAFRRAAGVQVEVPKPPLLVNPGGERIGIEEWLYSSQFDLDRFGNDFGIITERDGLQLPRRVDLVPAQESSVIVRKGEIDHYKIAGQKYDPRDIWHERQFTVPGLPVGLSPIAYAAWSIGTYLSAQEFALDWFGSGAAPSGHLRNTLVPTIDPKDADAIKSRFKNAVKGRDLFVTGRDWEYEMSSVPANTTMFLEEMKYGVSDVCRFLGVPGDLIDAETSTGSVTYASITQRNLQLLIMNLQPAFIRREKALSRALPAPRYVKFNTDAAVLRMDPEARSRKLIAEVSGRLISPSEAREIDNRQPFTDAQVAEFDRLFGNPNKSVPSVQQASAPAITVTSPPVTVDIPAIDARSYVTVQAPPVPQVHNNFEHVIDARTTNAVDSSTHFGPASIDARAVVDVHPQVMIEKPAENRREVTTIERDERGEIIRTVKES